MSADMNSLKNYVTAQDSQRFQNLPRGTVSVTVSHSNLNAKMIELKFDLHQTIESVKSKIYTHCGTNPGMQQLQLKSNGQTIAKLSDDFKMLGFYGVESGMEIHVVDADPFSMSRGGGLEDVSLVKKYRMSEEDYDNRKGTLRSWIKDNKAKDPNWVEPWNKKDETAQQAPVADEPPPTAESVAGMTVGDRCEVAPGGRRGTVMFLGEIENMPAGYWVGVKFDEPVGRGNGTVKGISVFEAPDKYAGFIRPKNITVGDYPEKDLMAELEGSDDDEI